MSAEPKGCLEDVAMAQWEEASVITVRGTVKSSGNSKRSRTEKAATKRASTTRKAIQYSLIEAFVEA